MNSYFVTTRTPKDTFIVQERLLKLDLPFVCSEPRLDGYQATFEIPITDQVHEALPGGPISLYRGAEAYDEIRESIEAYECLEQRRST